MGDMTPDQISRWLEANAWRLDGPAQWLGGEPNAVLKPWSETTVRWLIAASWPYFHSAGNQAIPAVLQAINDNPDYFADVSYLHETPRDQRIMEQDGVPVFGVQSRHQLADFDVAGTSISYMVLFMNFCKHLSLSGIPLRWRDREAQGPEKFPMIIVGGQAACVPGAMEPVADCVWIGEVEDEPGNPGGISEVCDRIAAFKQDESWSSNRLACYKALAREFNHLYFPRFTQVAYRHEDRSLEHPSKQVASIRPVLDGMRFPHRSRRVIDMDKIKPLRSAPLLYTQPGMGAGDIEVARSCPAWCGFPLLGTEEIITRTGLREIQSVAGQEVEIWTGASWQAAKASSHGLQGLQRVVLRPAEYVMTEGGRKWRRLSRSGHRAEVTATRFHGWWLVDGTETHDVRVGDFIPAATPRAEEGPDYDAGWVHGFLFGDGHQRRRATGERRPVTSGSFKVRLFGKDAAARPRFEKFYRPGQQDRNSWAQRPAFRVSSITEPESAGGDSVVYGWAAFSIKGWPDVQASPEYLAGFIAGWLAADASLRAKGTSWRLSASYLPKNHGDVSPGEWLSRYAAIAGWLYVGRSVNPRNVTNYGRRTAPLIEHTLVRPENHGWCVESIVPLDRTAEVFCLEVPESHRFALASGAVTGNCRLALTTKPYRQASVEKSVRHAGEWRDNMGSVEISPFSPDLPMHTQLKSLLTGLLENVSDEVDGTAMRIDDLIHDPDYLMVYTLGGANAVTLGLEGNSQRMRDLVGKGTSDKEVEETVIRGIRAGVTKFKFFMISQFPGEDEGDVMRIVRLGQRLDQIRAETGMKNVRYQFSWTPLLIEGQTPFQWFAPTQPDHTLIKVIEALRPHRIECKIGTKADPPKVALFQLCQRASRDVGEAIVDVLERHSVASWGGVPRSMRDDLDAALREHGFLNGLADCFDDRDRTDMFGWEHIDMGVSPQLLWSTHVQMVEFLQATNSQTYDEEMGEEYHGQEWIGRCDSHCEGAACGACEPADFHKRREYIAAASSDRDIHKQPVKPIDLSTVACKVRLFLDIPERSRFITREHWRYSLRRAAYRAMSDVPVNIAKRSIRFAGDEIKVRDWACGVDYAEFGLTQHVTPDEISALVSRMRCEMEPWLTIREWDSYAASGSLPAGALALYELEVDADPDSLAARLASWDRAEAVPLTLAGDTSYFGMSTEEVNAKELMTDLRVVRQGHKILLRFYGHGKAGPYQLASAFLGGSPLPLMKHPARRCEWFHPGTLLLGQEECIMCGGFIPQTLLGHKTAAASCPMCALHVTLPSEVFLVPV